VNQQGAWEQLLPHAFPKRELLMTRWTIVLGLVATALAFAGVAAAGTSSVALSMTLTEPLTSGAPGSAACPDIALNFNCGSGEVIPFGHATEEVLIGVCGATCNFRQIDLPQGSLFLLEEVTSFSCPGACGSQRPAGGPFTLTLADSVVGGTGVFAGATGSLVGTVVAAGWHGQVKLAGAITLDP
jgi:hypothetical protein